ncbi:unnamed protein product [Laminaria digitata]
MWFSLKEETRAVISAGQRWKQQHSRSSNILCSQNQTVLSIGRAAGASSAAEDYRTNSNAFAVLQLPNRLSCPGLYRCAGTYVRATAECLLVLLILRGNIVP